MKFRISKKSPGAQTLVIHTMLKPNNLYFCFPDYGRFFTWKFP